MPNPPPFRTLFDGADAGKWRMTTIRNQPGRDDPGRFEVVDGAFESVRGTDIGLWWHTDPTPPDFLLSLEWLMTGLDDNSGVFVRFPDPESKGYDNAAWAAVEYGFEIQIDNRARPDGDPVHLTAAVYEMAGPAEPERLPVNPPGEWNLFEILVVGQTYDIILNGRHVTHFVNEDPSRGLPSGPGRPSFVGLQTHTGRVRFRRIRIRPA